MPPLRAILTHAQVFCKKWSWKRAITLIIIGRFYPKSNFFKTRKIPNALRAGFSKDQWKGKPRKTQCPQPWHRYFKGQIYEKSVQNSILAAQAFGFRYLKKKVSVVSLIQGMPTCPYLCSTKYYQNISNHLEVMKCTRIWLRNSFGGVNLKK